MRFLLVAASLGLVLGSPAAPVEYEMAWTVSARLTVWKGGETVTTREALSGRATARLLTVAPAVLKLEFGGPEGGGEGYIGPAGPTALVFPSPLTVPVPPPLPHLTGGSFELRGTANRPEGFRLDYVEGFICRATPRVCGGVAMWEQRFEARAQRP